MSNTLTDSVLQRTLYSLAKASTKVYELRQRIEAHCLEVYGFVTGEIDNDEFIDHCVGGCGVCHGMTVKEFHKSMADAIYLHKLK